MSFCQYLNFDVPLNFGLDASAKAFSSNAEPHQPVEFPSDDHFTERYVHNFESHSNSLGSARSFPSSCDVSMFSNELNKEEKSNEIEKMLMSLGIEDKGDNAVANPEITGRTFCAPPGNAQINQLLLAQAYLAAMNFPWAVTPLQHQTLQSGVTMFPFGGSLPGNFSVPSNQTVAANPVFVIIPPIDPSSLQPKQYPSSDYLNNGQNHSPPSSPSRSMCEEVSGNVRKLFQDQAGCRLLQQKLQEGDDTQVASIYKESLQSLFVMMTDPFGNYLFQKLLENGTTKQCTEILREIKDSLVDAALTIHGTRSVQKILEFCKTPYQVSIIQSAILPRVVELCLDANGNHAIQKAVQCLSAKEKNFIYTSVMTNCKKIACHKHGCCVIQRCLDSASREQQRALFGTIIFHSLELMQDPFGNYVVQYVLDHGKQSDASAVAQKCIGSVVLLSTQKFSSNVMEKCLEKANEQLLAAIILELSAPATLLKLLLNQFANYVFQKAISVAPVGIARRLVDTIHPHQNVLRDNSGGRKILAKIEKRFPEVPGPAF